MRELKGLNGESVVLDGAWLEKLRSGVSVARLPVAGYREVQVSRTTRRRGLLSREREELLTVVFVLQTMIGLMLPAERRGELDAFAGALEAAARPAGVAGG